VFVTRFEECGEMLKGISQYGRSHRPWKAFLDDEARVETDHQWLRKKKWHGVISRHTTSALVQNCAELGIPLVDLNDTPPLPGVPKIRPDNIGIGHLGAEHFVERGFRNFGFAVSSTTAGRASDVMVSWKALISPGTLARSLTLIIQAI